jgi:transcriptional regulator with XRE-family HTH domain
VPPRRKVKPRSPEHAALGDAIKQLREQAGLTQEQLAELVETDLTQVGGLERGVRNPSYEMLHRLAKGLKVGVGEMTTLADQIRTRKLE